MKKILIIYSLKIVPDYKNIIKNAIESGFAILALDIESAMLVQHFGCPITFVEDWLSDKERVQLWETAVKLEKSFYAAIYGKNDDEFIFNIEDDHISMAGFWYEYALQKFLENSFIKNDVEVIRLPVFRRYGAAVAQSESSTFGVYWEKRTSKLIKVELIEIVNLKATVNTALDLFKGVIKYSYSKLSAIRKVNINQRQSIMLACSIGELYYHLPIMKELERRNGLFKLFIVLTNVNAIEADRISKKIGFEVFSGLNNFSNIKYKKIIKPLKEIDDIEIRNVYSDHKEHFWHFESVRWPSLDSKKKRYQVIMQENNVALVLVTGGEDRDHQFFGEVSNELGVPSISLPHGILAFTQRGQASTKFVGVGLKISEHLSRSVGTPSEKIIKLGNLDPLHEYPTNFIYDVKGEFSILVLLDPIKCSNDTRVYGHPMFGYKEQIEALRGLAKLMENKSYNIIIKTHPGWPESEVIEFADPKLMNSVCPKDTSLIEIVQKVNLVISLNYAAAALVAVARAEVPTIFYWTAPNLIQIPYGYAAVNMFLEMGDLVTNYNDLESSVEKFVVSAKYRGELRSKSMSFCNKYLESKQYQSVVDFSLQQAETGRS